MTTLSQDQLDAVCDVQDEDDALAELPELEVAQRLAASGHPMFEGFGAEPEPKPDPKPDPKSKKPAKRAPTQGQASPRSQGTAPAPAPTPGIPELETGAPAQSGMTVVSEEVGEPKRAAHPGNPGNPKDLPAAREQHAVTRPADPGELVEGMETLDATDMVIPRLKLKQAQTRDEHELGIKDIPDGDWFLTSDPAEALDRAREDPEGDRARTVALLEIRKGRQFLLPYREDDRAQALGQLGLLDVVSDEVNVICSSSDRIAPDVRDGQDWPPQASACAECPHARWTTGESGKRRPPACGETYRGIVVDLTDGQMTPAVVLFRSTAIRPAKGLLTNLRLAAKRRKLPACGFSVEFGSKRIDRARETYYVPAFSRPTPLEDPELVEELRAFRASFAHQEIPQDEAEE